MTPRYYNLRLQIYTQLVKPNRPTITDQELHKARIHSCQSEVHWKEINNLSPPKQTRLLLAIEMTTLAIFG